MVYSARGRTAMLDSHTLAQLGLLSEYVMRRWLFEQVKCLFFSGPTRTYFLTLLSIDVLVFGHQWQLSQKHRLSHASGSSVILLLYSFP